MGRLFWKFFLVFWLALLTVGIGVGFEVWRQNTMDMNAELNDDQQLQVDDDPFAPIVGAAGMILKQGGVVELRHFLEELRTTFNQFPPVLAVNEQGHDILDRKLHPGTLADAESMLTSYPNNVRKVNADDGHSYLIFVVIPQYNPWLVIVSGIFASLLFSGLLAWYLARPIQQLRSAFTSVSYGNLNTRAGNAMGNRHDELADLGSHFDHMVEKIQMLMAAQQRLLHDVSHELRSPLARIQAAIGLAHQQSDKTPVTLARIERESQRMSDLIGELLMLSRLETSFVGNLETIDLGELIAEIVEDSRFEADTKNVVIELNGHEEFFSKGHQELIRRAIENVLRNAVQHTKANSTINVVVISHNIAHQVKIVIEDQGNGILETELSTVFEPFYRGVKIEKTYSTGLGLTIAQRAIHLHSGEIKVSNRPEGGLRVEIILPLC